ncbi:MFS transporter [Pseudonocardia sp. CNS-139]|nr:MFS transporter [Pseudonocardia sp. CNS-139]
MSDSASPADYRAALTAPGALAPALASALGRFPIAMMGLAELLYVQRTSGSFASAGLVSAGALVGVALGSVGQGRVIDRLGPTRPLLVAAGLFAVCAAALVTAIQSRQPVGMLVALAVLTGLVQPALPGASRALWAELVPAGPRRDAAFSYEAISLEVFFILGPAVAALLVLAPWPGTAMAAAAAAMAVGSAAFALTPAVRATRPAPARRPVGALGALVRPGMRTVALASLGFGLVVGFVEVGVPAFAAEAGSPAVGGLLLSAWSVASVLAGVLYSMRPWPRPLHLRMPALLGGFGFFVGLMVLSGPFPSFVLLVVVMLAAGALITPQVTAHSLAVEVAAPAGTATEAFGWVVTAATLGISVGTSVAGVVVEAAGPPTAFLVGGLAGIALAVVLWSRRGTLAPGAQPRRYSSWASTDSSAAGQRTGSTSA